MRLNRGLNNLPSFPKGSVVTVGNFDGVHLGHQQVIKQLITLAKARLLPSVLLTFEPLPKEFLYTQAPARLTSLREKINYLQKTQLEHMVYLRFNNLLSKLPAEQFIEEILQRRLNVQCLLVGRDFRFGYQRQGDIKLLQQVGQTQGFDVVSVDEVGFEGNRVSSTAIRFALKTGDFSLAKAMLGRPYTILGRVAYGNQRGRAIGFPTANIPLKRLVSPLHGVYAVMVHGITEQGLPAVANIGHRPTINGNTFLLEVHILDFQANIYGRHLCVEFLKKIRDEERFASFDLLRQQIMRDTEQAKEFFQKST
jgi:riboflavin kinase/FMN adenylyltransferase